MVVSQKTEPSIWINDDQCPVRKVRSWWPSLVQKPFLETAEFLTNLFITVYISLNFLGPIIMLCPFHCKCLCPGTCRYVASCKEAFHECGEWPAVEVPTSKSRRFYVVQQRDRWQASSTQHPSSTAGSTAKKKRVDLPLCFTRMVASSECRLVHWRPMDGLVMPALILKICRFYLSR